MQRYEVLSTERIDVGDNLALASLGAGLTWAAVALRWTTVAPERTAGSPSAAKWTAASPNWRSLVRRQGRRVHGEIGNRRDH